MNVRRDHAMGPSRVEALEQRSDLAGDLVNYPGIIAVLVLP